MRFYRIKDSEAEDLHKSSFGKLGPIFATGQDGIVVPYIGDFYAVDRVVRLKGKIHLDIRRLSDSEVEDRFGTLPEPASDLFDAAVCRLIWGQIGVVRVRLSDGEARWEWGPGQPPSKKLLEKLASQISEPHQYSWGKTLVLKLEWGAQAPLGRFRKLLQDFWKAS